jgi:ribosome recycling factor
MTFRAAPLFCSLLTSRDNVLPSGRQIKLFLSPLPGAKVTLLRLGAYEEGMINDIQKDLVDSLGKAHNALKHELTKLRAGRANAGLLDGIKADYYGTPTPLGQMAHINVPEPRLITVKPWDKSAVKAVEKALRESELGLNPQVDGDLVRIPLPPLTEERRKEFVKIARKYGEECKVAIRKHRHDALDMLASVEADGGASADEVDRGKKKVEELVAEGVKHVDQMIAHKEKDILEV